jgi:hypothetical protein
MANPVPTGSHVSAGTYRRTDCGNEIEMGSQTHIPPCPECGNGEWDAARAGTAPTTRIQLAGSTGGSRGRIRR